MFQALKKYRAKFKNWPNVLFHVVGNSYPIKGIERNGNTNSIECYLQLSLLFFGIESVFSPIDHAIEFKWHENSIRIKDAGTRYIDIPTVFLLEVYKFLNPRNLVAFDIGANVGDSAIYFSLLGASRVVAVEPFFSNYRYLVENIRLNNAQGNIIPLNLALGAEDSELSVESVSEAGVDSVIVENKAGTPITQVSLSKLVNRYCNEDCVLKIDCEGCEYDTILGADNDTLRKFARIEIEYHHGYNKLVSRLEEAGFSTSLLASDGTKRAPSPEEEDVGYVLASRLDDKTHGY